MTFRELMDIRRNSTFDRTVILDLHKVGVDVKDYDAAWQRSQDVWCIVKAYMDAHPELP